VEGEHIRIATLFKFLYKNYLWNLLNTSLNSINITNISVGLEVFATGKSILCVLLWTPCYPSSS
jgi:hypothetical protein